MIEPVPVMLTGPEDREGGSAAAVKKGWLVYDLGKRIGAFLASKKERDNQALQVQEFFEQDFRKLADSHPGAVIALANPGILFEPELELNPRQLILWAARRGNIALIWPGREERGVLKLGWEESPYGVDFSPEHVRILQEEI